MTDDGTDDGGYIVKSSEQEASRSPPFPFKALYLVSAYCWASLESSYTLPVWSKDPVRRA